MSTDSSLGPPPDAKVLCERRKTLIKKTWRMVETSLQSDATLLFYERLFSNYPEVKPMFASVDMEMQAKKLYDVLRVAVRFLDNVEELVPTLQDMGARHALSYGVKRGHYTAVTQTFIAMMNDIIEEKLQVSPESLLLWKMDVAAAWAWVLTLLGNTMADAGEVAVAQKNQKNAAVESHLSSSPPVTTASDKK